MLERLDCVEAMGKAAPFSKTVEGADVSPCMVVQIGLGGATQLPVCFVICSDFPLEVDEFAIRVCKNAPLW